MLNAKELRDKVFSLNKEVLNLNSRIRIENYNYGREDTVQIKLTEKDGVLSISNDYNYKGCFLNAFKNNIDLNKLDKLELRRGFKKDYNEEVENLIDEYLQIPIEDLKSYKTEDEKCIEDIDNEVKEIEDEIQSVINENIEKLQKLATLKDILMNNIAIKDKAIDTLNFNVNDVVVENMNSYEETERKHPWRENDVENNYIIKNKVFTLSIEMKDDESWRTKKKRKDIRYSFTITLNNIVYLIDKVQVYKDLDEYEKYIENLKKRYAKYFTEEIPDIPTGIYGKLSNRNGNFFTINELLSMGYKVK